MLRSYDLFIFDDAAWAGGLLVLLLLLAAEVRVPRRAAAASNMTLLAAFSLLLMTLGLVLDQGPWSADPLARLYDAAKFFASFAPLAIAQASRPATYGLARVAWLLIMLAFLMLGTMLGTALRAEESVLVWPACLLALCAAAIWAAPRKT